MKTVCQVISIIRSRGNKQSRALGIAQFSKKVEQLHSLGFFVLSTLEFVERVE